MPQFRCVLAAELNAELRSVYVENFPEIAEAYLEHFPPERTAVTPGLEDLYDAGNLRRIHGDIAALVDLETSSLRQWPGGANGVPDYIVPEHDLLCAGFPCQPFSKSGAQRGFDDLNGTVFHMIAVILKYRRPRYVLFENVGNFEKHDNGNTWKRVRAILEDLGYLVKFRSHVGNTDGLGLLSPHHLGFPHHRERFFIVAEHADVATASDPFPVSHRATPAPQRELARREAIAEGSLRAIISQGHKYSSAQELAEAQVTPDRVACINHWGELLDKIVEVDPTGCIFQPLPSFPIWGYELDPWQWYPAESNPIEFIKHGEWLARSREHLLNRFCSAFPSAAGHGPAGTRTYLREPRLDDFGLASWVDTWPGYAGKREHWPRWKSRFIEQNREWAEKLWGHLDPAWLRQWMDKLNEMPPSLQKLEWNCKGEDLNIWQHILQFRPSGLRVKRLRHVPALVAMTTTQVPIVPRLNPAEPLAGGSVLSRGRHLLPAESLQLQGFPPDWRVPRIRDHAHQAFGNAVHALVVQAIITKWLVGPWAQEVNASVAAGCQQPGQVVLSEHVRQGELFDLRPRPESGRSETALVSESVLR
jgi:DNA (cytosine-5)-methyltransferase 1